jgi:hypothetical protein
VIFGNPLDEFLLPQSGECRTLLTKQADERVRHTIPHGLNALLKPSEFLLNLNQFFACICQTSRCSSHGFILAKSGYPKGKVHLSTSSGLPKSLSEQ